MKVFDPDLGVFTKKGIEESEKLSNELKKITAAGGTDQFDNEIFSAHEKVRRAEVVQVESAVLAGARKKFEIALRKKREFKVQIENQRNAIFRRLEEISGPVIQYLSECIDESVSRIWRLRIFRHSGIETSVFNDKMTTEVETNLSRIYEVREMLLNFKSKIQGMCHFPLKEILTLSQEAGEKVNFIDIGKADVVSMSLYEAQGIEADLKETKSSVPIPPEVSRLAEVGWLSEKYDEISAKVKKAMGG